MRCPVVRGRSLNSDAYIYRGRTDVMALSFPFVRARIDGTVSRNRVRAKRQQRIGMIRYLIFTVF